MLRSTRRRLVGLGAVLLVAPHSLLAAAPAMEVWKNRGCACCSAWARPFQAAGFAVTMHEVDDVDQVRAAAGVPGELAGCHTAKVDGYVVEGHVPLADVQRILAERPAIAGIAVPGMPMGSAGMEMEGMPAATYEVIAFRADGSRYVFRAVPAGG